jgi:hypothetical protein
VGVEVWVNDGQVVRSVVVVLALVMVLSGFARFTYSLKIVSTF